MSGGRRLGLCAGLAGATASHFVEQTWLIGAEDSQQQAQQCMQAGVCPPALVQQMMTADRSFARCMRSHGVPGWPDPVIGPNGGPVFKVSAAGITHTQTHSPPMENTIMACLRVDPAPVALS